MSQNTSSTTTTTTPSNKRKDARCIVCDLQLAKYRCPACDAQTCSLPCSKQHKTDTSCTGVRSRTNFVPLEKFDDNVVLDDFNFLNEIEQTNSRARRSAATQHLPYSLGKLQALAKKRNIYISFMPQVMTRRKENTTWFEKETEKIFWKVEWIFCDKDNKVKLIDAKLDETTSLQTALSKHFQDIENQTQLKKFVKVGVDKLYYLLKAEFNSKNEYYKLNSTQPLMTSLAYKPIIEHPTILVVLPTEIDNYRICAENSSGPSNNLPPAKKQRTEEDASFFPLT